MVFIIKLVFFKLKCDVWVKVKWNINEALWTPFPLKIKVVFSEVIGFAQNTLETLKCCSFLSGIKTVFVNEDYPRQSLVTGLVIIQNDASGWDIVNQLVLLHLRVLTGPHTSEANSPTWGDMPRKFMPVKAKQGKKLGGTNWLINTPGVLLF